MTFFIFFDTFPLQSPAFCKILALHLPYLLLLELKWLIFKKIRGKEMKKSLLLFSFVGVFGMIQAQDSYWGRLYTWYKGPKHALKRELNTAMSALNKADAKVALQFDALDPAKKITEKSYIINDQFKQAIGQAKDLIQFVVDELNSVK